MFVQISVVDMRRRLFYFKVILLLLEAHKEQQSIIKNVSGSFKKLIQLS